MALQPSGDARGITPACAGITSHLPAAEAHHGDHPRVCGNYAATHRLIMLGRGSPPRVRELPVKNRVVGLPHGITPACAGITYASHKVRIVRRDHPRVCGNYLRVCQIRHCTPGSPPRVRELLVPAALPELWIRITPACAGITPAGGNFAAGRKDHPRVCGNYLSFQHHRELHLGSPPRVRELPYEPYAGANHIRITPACAGITA